MNSWTQQIPSLVKWNLALNRSPTTVCGISDVTSSEHAVHGSVRVCDKFSALCGNSRRKYYAESLLPRSLIAFVHGSRSENENETVHY